MAWAPAARAFGEAVERYHEARGQDAAAAAVRSTVRTNTELVPERAQAVMRLLERLGGRTGLEHARVVEAGCGFGALAAYLAWRCDSTEVLAFDVREDFVEAARESAAGLGARERLRYEHGDMRTFGPVPDGWADVVVLNNAFIYLPAREDMLQAAAALRRALAPGGHVVVHQANRWRLRDPFSGDPVVHLLPPRAAEAVSRRTGWTHNHGRVRLLSPPAMALLLRRAGLEDVRIGAPRRGGIVTGRTAWLAPFYGVVARAPAA